VGKIEGVFQQALRGFAILTFTRGRTAMPKKSVAVKKLSKQLVEEVLANVNVAGFHTRDRDGNLTLKIPSDGGECDLLCWFQVTAEFFYLVCTLSPSITQRQWPNAVAVCNAYHRYSILGRAVLNIREGQQEASLCFEAAIDCSDGVSEAFLQNFIVTHLASACFFRDLASSHKLWSASKMPGDDPVIFCSQTPSEA
jgi:hypothetical protein